MLNYKHFISSGNQLTIVCHRGLWGTSPENSISSIQKAIHHNLSIVEIDLYYRAVSGLPHTEDEGQRYVDLGVHHLTLVNPSAVVALGGGKILVDEFKAEIDEEGNGDMNRKWHLFNPTTRRKNVGPGSRVEDVEEEIEICGLVAIDHPQLIKHV